MFKSNTDTLVLVGRSGAQFTFKICEFDTMQAIDGFVQNFNKAGLYLFAYRYTKLNDPRYWYSIKYIGETEDYSKRNYASHHKKKEIEAERVNAWGYCFLTDDDEKRIASESDLIARYNPPCNG